MRTKFWHHSRIDNAILGWPANCARWKVEHTQSGLQVIASIDEGAACPPDYCFPARLEEIAILNAAMCAIPKDPRARYCLGNLLYDRRHDRKQLRCGSAVQITHWPPIYEMTKNHEDFPRSIFFAERFWKPEPLQLESLRL